MGVENYFQHSVCDLLFVVVVGLPLELCYLGLK